MPLDDKVPKIVESLDQGGRVFDRAALQETAPFGRAGEVMKIERTAVISECGRYRYRLTRRWGRDPVLVFVMLNPSTADARVDDATIRKCMGFAERFGYGAIDVVNLFAYRATKPTDMHSAADPVGPENDLHVVSAARSASEVVCAWGRSASRTTRPLHVLALLRCVGTKPKCLHITQDGSPGHPLMLSYERPLLDYGTAFGSKDHQASDK